MCMKENNASIPRLVCLLLSDGRAVIANCSEPRFRKATDSEVLTLTGDDAVEQLPAAKIRDAFVIDPATPVPPNATVFNFISLN